MTKEEAIEILQEERDYAQFPQYVKEAIKVATSAIEKQIPKHPKKKEETQYSTFYDCPCCGGYLVSKIDGELCCGQEYKYCYHCGQALDWSNAELTEEKKS